MHKLTHGVVAMLTREVLAQSPYTATGVLCRSESIHLLLADGSEYFLPEILIPHGEPSLTMRAAALALKSDSRRSRAARIWHQLRPSRQAGELVAD